MAERDPILGDMKKCWRIEPRARVGVHRAARQSFKCRDVRVSEDDQVTFSVRRLHACRRRDQAATAIARRIVATRMRAVVGKRCREIRMQPPERSDRQRIPEQASNEAISLVFIGAQSVPVFDVHAPRADLIAPRAEPIVDADVAAEHVAAPTVVVAGDHDDLHAGVDDVGKGGERSKSAARNDCTPFEPELEQITIDDERSAMRRDVSQERDDRSLDFIRREAEVCVGEDVARRVEHARILRVPCALYKRRHADELGRVTTDSTTVSPAPLHHDVEFRVRYAETDQMGIVHHATYLIWCEVGRTDFIRARGMSYAEMERAGVLLAVSELTARFHSAARFDDMIRVRTTLTEVRSRGIVFDYLVTRAVDGHRLVSARTSLISIDSSGRPIALPPSVRALFGCA